MKEKNCIWEINQEFNITESVDTLGQFEMGLKVSPEPEHDLYLSYLKSGEPSRVKFHDKYGLTIIAEITGMRDPTQNDRYNHGLVPNTECVIVTIELSRKQFLAATSSTNLPHEDFWF